MSNHFPTYLSRNPSGYYVFRIRIPRDIINALDGKTEIRRSPRTRSRSKALRCGIKLSNLLQSLFEQTRAKALCARDGGNFMTTEFTQTEINFSALLLFISLNSILPNRALPGLSETCSSGALAPVTPAL